MWIDEFSLNSPFESPQQFIAFLINTSVRLLLTIALYLVARLLLVPNIVGSATSDEVFLKLYESKVLDFVGIAFIVVFFIITVTRIIYPVRFSPKMNLLLLLGFIIYLIEKYFWVDVFFYEFDLIGLDYPWLFILFPVSEIFLRTIYVLRIELSQVNGSLFIENKPVIISKDDKIRSRVITKLAEELKKSKFDSSYSIGIVGDWGIGKSSFVKTLDYHLAESAIIVHFRPWLSLGKNSLVQGFSDALTEKLGAFDRGLVYDFDRYIKSLIQIEENSPVSIGTTIQDILDAGQKSKLTEFDNLNRAISSIGKRVVIFIDDLDRLDAVEIVEVLKLIRNTANFSNVIYVSCYDKLYLLHALERFNKRNLSLILEKFFDFEIPVSPIAGKDLIGRLDTFFTDNNSEIRQEEIGEIKDFLLTAGLFTQFRDTNRFLTSLAFNFQLYGSKLSFEDFFFFELLKVRYPFLPGFLWTNRDDFFHDEFSPPSKMLTKAKVNLEPGGIQFEYAFEEFLHFNELDEFNKNFLSPKDLDVISVLLKRLLSGDNQTSRAFQQPNAFANYFYYEIEDSDEKPYDFYKAVKKKTYYSDTYFEHSYDAKKESEIFLFLEDKEKLKREFLSDKELVFDFLIFIIQWSNGRINSDALVKAYDAFRDTTSYPGHFENIMGSATQDEKHLLARMNFLSALIRNLIYSKDSNHYFFTDLDRLIFLNFSLFERFIVLSKEFTNRSFDGLYFQIVSIAESNRKVKINIKAIERFKEFINVHRTQYLDLNIRSAMIPNYEVRFVFEPLTFKIFKDQEELRGFIENSDFPDRRKKQFLAYLALAKENFDDVYEFALETNDLRYLPIEFENAWRDVPREVKERIRFVESEMNFVFENEASPKNHPDRNDIFYSDFISLPLHGLTIEITPGDTRFWRLGLTFLNNREFPRLEEGRQLHSDRPTSFIQVGERNNNNQWILPENVEIHDFYLSAVGQNAIRSTKLKPRDKVTISISIQDKRSATYVVDLKINDSLIGSKTYNLSKWKFVLISAWAENSPFKLSAKMLLSQPV